MRPRLCDCPEPEARGEDWPDDMHVHDGCRMYHRGKVCHLNDRQAVLPLEARP